MLVIGYGRFSTVYHQDVPKRRQSNNMSYVITQMIEELISTASEARGCAYLSRTFVIFFFGGVAAQRGPWSPHFYEVLSITHNDAPLSVGLLWTSDQLVAETST
jgi:hypothetical protein